MRPKVSARLVAAIVTIASVAAGLGCADSTTRPTAPDGQRLRFDAVDSVAASSDSTSSDSSGVAPADSTAAPTDSAVADAPADDTSFVAPPPDDEEGADLTERPSSVTPQLLVCPTQESASAQAVVGPEGGSVEARGTTITIPAGAVPEPTLFEVVVPASQFRETEIHAVGSEHYVFQQPATITINIARCPAGALPETAKPQGAHIDPATHKILELMGGVYDRSGHKVSFSTGHLSGYIVAY